VKGEESKKKSFGSKHEKLFHTRNEYARFPAPVRRCGLIARAGAPNRMGAQACLPALGR